MACSSCGTQNPAGVKFCIACGTRLAETCAACGAPRIEGAAFCGECGTPFAGKPAVGLPAGTQGLGGARQGPASALADASPTAAGTPGPSAAAVASAPAPVAERRLVSILFADLVGFTPFAEDRDAEDVRDTLTRYFDLASEVITRYGGTVEKFIGDAVMAVWGAPTAREDDAERAVRAGLELVDAVRALGAGIRARAGVLTGEAAVTIGALNQGMVAGDLVNTASRLQSIAPPGAVLVGEATMRAASRAIAFEEAGDQVLKGKAAPVPAWRAMRVVAEVGGRNRAEGLEAPFVGRDEELRLLKDQYHATGRERRARLVSIIGPAGIGKSRLAWEFEKYLDGLVEAVWWHHGRSPSYGEGITFWALGEMVRSRCGLRESDDEATTRVRVAETLARWVPDEQERRWIEPALLALLGVGELRQGGSDQLFAAWRSFFERIAAEGTVVLVFEDLHWADPGTLDFVDHLLEWSRAQPIYVVTLARPELLERRSSWGAGKRHFTSVFLEPLPEAAMRELLAGLVPGLPEVAARAIVARADGVPLYAVETVRMLVSEGRLALTEDGTFAPAGDMTSLAVPETLHALIAARLDALDMADRSLLADAAVLGQSFTPAALAAVSGLDEPGLEPRLRTLVRRELLTLRADPRSPELGQYMFVQALIREVAYGTLARADRRRRHLAAARHFEGVGTDELAGALATHYLAAYHNTPEGPEADALASQARLALRGAADRAIELGAHEQAVTLMEQALEVTVEQAERAELHEKIGESASTLARHDDAEAHLRTAVEIHRERGDRVATARATAALGRVMLTGRRASAAMTLLESAVAEFADLGDDPAAVAIGGQLARAAMFVGEFERAVQASDPVLAAAEHADLTQIIADTLVTKGSALCSLGRLREGAGLIRVGGELAESLGLTQTAIRALNNRSSMTGEIDPRSALEAAVSGLALARRLGLRFWTVSFVSNAANNRIRTGEWDVALADLEAELAQDLDRSERWGLLGVWLTLSANRGAPVAESLAEFERLTEGIGEDRVTQSQILDMRTNVAFAEGRPRDARDLALASNEMAQYPTALALAARCALWLGDAEAARADLAAHEATGQHGPAHEASRLTLRAGIAALEGRRAEALTLYRDALSAWRDLGLEWDEALCAIDMATTLGPGETEVRAAADAARETLVRLGARPFLDRLEKALADETSPTPAPATDRSTAGTSRPSRRAAPR